ncbi:MAG TPA: 3-hydroxyacyl-ACP dehydratase FabZ [Desulfobacteraceae bacterium]|nr:3-hydroxyacyl-ACP dehydratase FabZ [Desulfobacteraceae bacterium]
MKTEFPCSISDIMEILPHRSPFLFVSRVLKMESGKRIIAEKDLLPEDCFFSGHFPGRPIMPGVIVSEALAQTSGLLLGLTFEERAGNNTLEGKTGLFVLANISMKFTNTAIPGQTLILESELKKSYGNLFLFDVRAETAGKVIAKGTLTLAGES